MIELPAAAALLLATHYGISSTPLRAWLVARIGERPYLALYSLVALGALVWLISAYRRAPYIELWAAPAWSAWLPLVVLPFALLLLVCGVSALNPTAVGSPDTLEEAEPARGVLRVTRHPFMWGAGLWALVHLIVNGDQASVIFFGSFALLALLGTVLIDMKRTRNPPPGWGVFLQATSNIPLAAILQRRQRLVPREIGLARVAATLALYVLLLWLHPRLFGASPLP